MKIVWSNGAKKAFSRIDERYQRRIEVKLAELDDRSAPRPDIKKNIGERKSFPATRWRLPHPDYTSGQSQYPLLCFSRQTQNINDLPSRGERSLWLFS